MKKNEKQAYEGLFEAISLIQDEKEAELFMQDLCTPAELQALADRWNVVKPILAGKAYRNIHDETGVSVTTIGRVARFITQGSGGYNIIYKRLEKENATRKIKDSDSEKG